MRALASTSAGPAGTWLTRTDGSLPKVSGANVLSAALEESVRLPTLHEIMGAQRLDALVRESGSLPRLTAAMSERAARATAKAFAAMKLEAVANTSREASRILESLNEPQRTAVIAEPGLPCLVLAGPGSGKTRVLTHRAAHLVQDLGVSPHRIVAVTFTNKAAGEMKDRIDALLDSSGGGGGAGDMVVGTFHAICARLLRTHGLGIGIPSNFDIADTSDARSVLTQIVKERQAEDCSSEVVGEYVRHISMIKNERGSELRALLRDTQYSRVVEMRGLYDEKMRSMNKLDFDDLLVETRKLLNDCQDVRHLLQTRFHHVLVDEWQDTNTVQYDIVSVLAATHRNLFVVGDADQSIYKFRGADSRNVNRFEKDFHDAQTVALVENYRSTRCIVEAAQAVIRVNRNRPAKEMMTSNEFGDQIDVTMADDQNDEVHTIVRRARSLVRASAVDGFSNVAILYRTNAQSRLFEEACVRHEIPYRLIGGLRFYERQEIKDLLAYVRLLRNPLDDTSLKRAINTPPRGIGTKTVESLEAYAVGLGVSMLAALDTLFGGDEPAGEGGAMFKGGAKKKLAEFHLIVQSLRDGVSSDSTYTVEATLSQLLELTAYQEYSAKIGGTASGADKAAERWRNVQELQSAASRHESLDSFLESVALVSDVKDVDDGEGRITRPQALSLMTLHGGKGLEFSCVFVAGMEEGLVPMIFKSSKSRQALHEELEEERRLAYVGMTRARKFLHLSWRRRKLVMRPGKGPFYSDSARSRFLGDIPADLVNERLTDKAKSNLWRSEGASKGGGAGSGEGTNAAKGAKGSPGGAKSTITSYGSTGTPSPVAAAYNPRVSATGQAARQQFNVGDSVRENVGNMRGVVVSAGDSATVEILFANGKQRAVPKAACTVLFSV